MSGPLRCPRCGSYTKPSRRFPVEGWYDCPGCFRVIGEPDWDDPNDPGVILEPDVDFYAGGRVPKRRSDRRGSSSRGKGRPKPVKRTPHLFPLPIPPPGGRMVIKNSKQADT